jgi:hypothetical protein
MTLVSRFPFSVVPPFSCPRVSVEHHVISNVLVRVFLACSIEYDNVQKPKHSPRLVVF